MRAPSRVDPVGLSCLRCGGGLDLGTDEVLLHCRYCGTGHEVVEEQASVPASMPGRWEDSRSARESLREALRRRGIRAWVTTETDLHWLVFWRVRAKLVGWQTYQKRPDPVTSSSREVDAAHLAPAERVEELVARDVDVTIPACNTRSFDLVGISDRVASLEWSPFSAERLGEPAHLSSVTVPRAVALRRAELLRRGGLVPRGATGAVQRISLLRATTRLLYYPVWRLHFTASGWPGVANVDAIRGRILGGHCTGRVRSAAPGWYAAAGACGWLAGLHPALAAFGLAGWTLHRASREGLSGGVAEAGSWMSEELGRGPRRRIALES